MPDGRNIHDIRIGGMGGDTGDLMRILKPHSSERSSAVRGFVNPIPPTAAVAVVGFAGAHPDDIGISLEKSHISDRAAAVIGQRWAVQVMPALST